MDWLFAVSQFQMMAIRIYYSSKFIDNKIDTYIESIPRILSFIVAGFMLSVSMWSCTCIDHLFGFDLFGICSWIRSFSMDLSLIYYYIGFIIVQCGHLLLTATHHIMQNNWTAWITIQKEHQLITNGVFGFVRHPMYSSIVLYLIGFTLITGNLIVMLTWLMLLLMVALRMDVEEYHLREKFGCGYDGYCQKTKYQLIPYVY